MFTHGLLDVVATEMNPGLTVEQAGRIQVVRPGLAILGDLLLLALIVYLWKSRQSRSSNGEI